MTTPANEVVLGYDGFTEQPIKRVETIGQPTKTIRTFEGPQHLSDDFAEYLKLNYSVLNLSNQKGVPAIIEIETDENADATAPELKVLAEVTWSLDWEKSMKDLKAHPYFHPSGSTAWSECLEQIDLAIKKGTAAKTDWDTFFGVGHYNDYRNSRLAGVDHYPEFAPVIRATLVMGRYSILKAPSWAFNYVTTFDQIKLPFTGAASTPVLGGIEQPWIRVCPNGGATDWTDVAIDQWFICPIKRGFTKIPPRYEMVFEWQGAEKYLSYIYDGGSGTLP